MVSFSAGQEVARALLEGPQRYTCLAGGTRSGKTFLIVRSIVQRAIQAPKSHHVILRFHANAAHASIALPVAGTALCRPAPSRGDVLGVGIFFAGLSGVALRIEPILARDLAKPFILNTDFAAVSIFSGLLGLVCFLWAPYASDGRVQRERWGYVGLMVAVGVGIAFAVNAAHHFVTPSPVFRFE